MRMKLAAKGRRAPPPVLDGPFQGLSEEVQSWPGIVAATHWHFLRTSLVDGADFYRGDEELGHIHLDGEVHLATSPAIARALIGAQLAEPFPWSRAGEWVTYRIHSEEGIRHAERLMRMAYDYLGGTPDFDLIEALFPLKEIVRAHGKAMDDSAP